MTEQPSGTDTAATCRTGSGRQGETELRRLRRLIREQLAGAVSEDRLDITVANGMLAACGLPELPRRWTVRVGLTFVCEVTAGTDDDAFDTAEDAIAAAVTDAGCPIDIDWDGREHLNATQAASTTTPSTPTPIRPDRRRRTRPRHRWCAGQVTAPRRRPTRRTHPPHTGDHLTFTQR